MHVAEEQPARHDPRGDPGRQHPRASPQHEHAVAGFERGIAGQQQVGRVGGVGGAQRIVGDGDCQAADLNRPPR